ncbi:hypothetical protein CYMTET_11478 [Cymbomonas tetramitiformis]|uniref:Uncharacterized protein n=1 Tax=Cymbomonas tetramitiformis TaxID=36881 RepID=A0AAE0LD47_9CHLO|nr:hypothetical protein CYMTET_11478 [Cymbomonas tetramitiformis]
MQAEGANREESSTSQRHHYTGSKEDDREEFCLVFSRWITGKQRAHRSSVRRTLDSPMMLKASPEEKRNYKNNSQPDWQGMYEEIPSFLQSVGNNSGTPSEAYSWLMKPLDLDGMVASRFTWFLKSTEDHEAADGAVNCADQPFHLMDRNATWVVARPVTEEDDDGEVSDEYPRDGNSLTGLTGCDGKESTMSVLLGLEEVRARAQQAEVSHELHQGEECHAQGGAPN